jgi:beta-N-acetylhexosaminidase
VTLKEKLGQLFVVGIAGQQLTPAEETFLVENNIGGVILMGRNAKSPEQVHQLCSSIQKLRHKTKQKTPFFISIDMEGGRVARLKEPFTQWPPLRKLGDIDSPSLAFHMAMSMGKELRAVGINLDFAPCVDVLTNPTNTAIGDRALSDNPETVAKMASALVRGYMKSEVMTCAKHFPGHGNTVVDSHEELPVEEADLERLQALELVPFRRAIRSRVDLIMMSHVLYKKLDPQYPATLSVQLTQKLLREELRFRGLIVTDDLDMKALSNNFPLEEIPVRAIEAGSDLLLYCNDPSVPPKALAALEKAVAEGRLSLTRIEDSFQRIAKAKRDSILTIDPRPWSEVKELIGSAEHRKIAKAIEEGKVPEGLATTAES